MLFIVTQSIVSCCVLCLVNMASNITSARRNNVAFTLSIRGRMLKRRLEGAAQHDTTCGYATSSHYSSQCFSFRNNGPCMLYSMAERGHLRWSSVNHGLITEPWTSLLGKWIVIATPLSLFFTCLIFARRAKGGTLGRICAFLSEPSVQHVNSMQGNRSRVRKTNCKTPSNRLGKGKYLIIRYVKCVHACKESSQ